MKKHLKVFASLLCMLLACLIFASCDLLALIGGTQQGGTVEEWTPTGKEIILIRKNSPSKYVFIYEDSDDAARAAASAFRTDLMNRGLNGSGATIYTASRVFDPVNDLEILFGKTDRTASVKAAELLEQKVAADPASYHWVFCYWDGKLAIIASNETAYSLALNDMPNVLISAGNLAFKDDLMYHGTMSVAEYEEIENEKRKEENEKKLPDLLESIDDQRDDLAVLKGTWNKYAAMSATNPQLYLFTNYTKNLGNSEWGTVKTTPSDEHPRLLITKDSLPLIKEYLLSDDANARRFIEKLRDATLDNGGELSSNKSTSQNATVNGSNVYNWNAYNLEVIQAKALAYLVYGDEYYGYQAIYYMKNYIKTLDIEQIASDQCRQYGYVMFTAAIVYDWCYDLLTDVDKTQLIAGVENCICRGANKAGDKMEVGFPPAGQDSIAGHGSEYQIMRDYLSFAIAIYGDNDSWWTYIAPRVYNDYPLFRNYYFQSGMTPQGTGTYIPARHIADLYSAWLLQVATGSHPFEGMENTIRSTLGYEFAPGLLFNDGDGTGDSVKASQMLSMAYISAFLFEDSAMLAQANYLLNGAAFTTSPTLLSGYAGIGSITYLALRGMCELEPSEDRHEGMDLIQYNGYPLGQYIARTAWDTADAAAIFMRIKERSTSGHEHSDTGTFEIYYKGMLTSDGGAYNNFWADHTQYFHQATISHNGLLIYNPANATEDKGYYSGGQRNPNTPGNTFDQWVNNDDLVTATVTGREHGYNDDGTPLYAYVAGDITKAYYENTVSYVGRRMLTVFTGDASYPMVFFVYDDISAKNPSFERTFLLQISSKDAPTIDTANKTVITENGEGRLVLTCLSDNVNIIGAGGRAYTASGKYDCANSQNYLVNGKQFLPMNGTADDGHWGRVEIKHSRSTESNTFMNVLYVTDKGNTEMASVRGTVSDNGLTGGVFNESVAALFAADRNGAKSEISCKTFGSESMSYYVSGVAEGKWTVSVDGKTIGTYTASAEGGMLTFEAPAGVVTITPAK